MTNFITAQTKKTFNLVEVIILSSYYLTIGLLVFGLLGILNRWTSFLLLLGLVFLFYFYRRQIILTRRWWWFFIVTPLAVSGFGLLRGFFIGDAYELYLPVAREIATTGSIPVFYVGYNFSQMPLLSLLFGWTFSLFNFSSEYLCLWVPFVFTAATLLVMYLWAQEKGLDKQWLPFLGLLFLTNIGVAFWGGWNLLQEPLVLFFATTFFYYYDHYLADNQKRNLIYCLLSFILAAVSKISGLFLAFLLLWLFLRKKNKKIFIIYALVLAMPLLVWLVRNYVVFGNPLFPLFSGLFRGPYYLSTWQYSVFHTGLTTLNRHLWTWNKLQLIGSYLITGFPLIFLASYEFIRQKRVDFFIFIFSFILLKETFLFTPTVSTMRYYYFLLGLIIVYGLLGVQHLKNKIVLAWWLAVAVAGLLFVPIIDSTSSFISSFENQLTIIAVLSLWLQTHWLIIGGIVFILALLLGKENNLKLFLVGFYGLYLLFLKFVANKSFLNTWTFIILALILLIFFIGQKEKKYLAKLIVSFLLIVALAASWLLGGIYYLHQGALRWPNPTIWSASSWAVEVLDQQAQTDIENFYILTAAQMEYFNWRTSYQAINFGDVNFWIILLGYRSDFTADQLKGFLTEKKIKYIVKNETKIEFDNLLNQEFGRFFELVKISDKFKLLASQNDQHFVWQVY